MDENKPIVPAADLARAADTLGRLAQQQKDLVLIQEVVSKIGSLTGSAEEAERRAAEANAEADRLTGNLTAIQDDIDRQNAIAKDTRQSLINEGQVAKADILAGVGKITADANAEAGAILGTARRQAQEILDTAIAREASITQLANQRSREADDAQARLDSTGAELDQVTARLAKAKEAMKAALAE